MQQSKLGGSPRRRTCRQSLRQHPLLQLSIILHTSALKHESLKAYGVAVQFTQLLLQHLHDTGLRCVHCGQLLSGNIPDVQHASAGGGGSEHFRTE
eukprot:s1415_g1.t1